MDSPLDARVKKGLVASCFKKALRAWGHSCGSAKHPEVDDPMLVNPAVAGT